MAHPVHRLLKIHGYKYNDVEIKSINSDSINIIDADGNEYNIRGDVKTLINESTIEITKTKKTRGWHMKAEFIDTDGTVYHFGVEQPK